MDNITDLEERLTELNNNGKEDSKEAAQISNNLDKYYRELEWKIKKEYPD